MTAAAAAVVELPYPLLNLHRRFNRFDLIDDHD